MGAVVVRFRSDARYVGRTSWVGRGPVPRISPGLATDLHAGVAWVGSRFAPTEAEQVRRLALAGHLEWDLVDASGSVRCTASASPEAGVRVLPGFLTASTGEPSRFAFVHRVDGRWYWESAASGWRVDLPDPGLVARPDPALASFAAAFGLTVESDSDEALAAWEFHDLLFARRSRMDGGGGATFPFVDVRPLPSPARPLRPGERTSLRRPGADAIPTVGYFDVVAGRRSVHRFAPTIDVTDVGDLLHWTLRRTVLDPGDRAGPRSYAAARRPVPGAGAMHPVQAWVQAFSVTGLDPGTWWYDDEAHALHRVGPFAGPTRAPYDAPAQILLAYQHDRVGWKYERIAHTLALKDAGVVLGALHLTAAALGLASTIIGSGGLASVVAQLGEMSSAMTPVGEIVVGRPVGPVTDQPVGRPEGVRAAVSAEVSVVPT